MMSFSQSSYDGNNTSESFQVAVNNAKKLLGTFQTYTVMTPVEQKSADQIYSKLNSNYLNSSSIEATSTQQIVVETSHNKTETTPKSLTPVTDTESSRNTKINKNIDNLHQSEAIEVINSLVGVLKNMSKEIQQLKFMKMILASQENEYKSKYDIEVNLLKQEFEKIRSQLTLENENITTKLKNKENKVVKYKGRIMDKNLEINRLMRILNENSIADISQTVDTSTGSHRKSSFPTMHLIRTDYTIKEKASGMLATLGLLASQVLNDKTDLEQESLFSRPPKLHDVSNEYNITETELAQGTDVDATTNLESNYNNNSTILSSSSSFNRPILSKASPPKIQLPKMKSFSTIDGTVRDIL